MSSQGYTGVDHYATITLSIWLSIFILLHILRSNAVIIYAQHHFCCVKPCNTSVLEKKHAFTPLCLIEHNIATDRLQIMLSAHY